MLTLTSETFCVLLQLACYFQRGRTPEPRLISVATNINYTVYNSSTHDLHCISPDVFLSTFIDYSLLYPDRQIIIYRVVKNLFFLCLMFSRAMQTIVKTGQPLFVWVTIVHDQFFP